MSLRYKFFAAFSVVVALACGLAFYGIRGMSTAGDLVVRLYDGPLMGINHARSAHAALNEARLVMQRSRNEAAPDETLVKFKKLLADIEADLKIVRERIHDQDVLVALERAERRIRDWSEAELKILQPPPGGLTLVPAAFSVARKSEQAIVALDDLVEMAAAYGFNHRMEADATVAAMRAAVLTIAVGTALIGLMLAAAFAYSMTKPILAAMHVAERVAAGNLSDRIEVRRRDELGRLLTSLAAMQASLKARADEDHALMLKNESMTQMISALSATNEAIMRAETREELFKVVCEAAILGGKFTTTVVALAEPGSDFLRTVAASGSGAVASRGVRLSVSEAHPEGRGLSGTAFRTRQPCVSNDYLADQKRIAFHGVVRETSAKSGAALPLLSRGQSVGVILFMAEERDVFTPEFVELLQRLAGNVSYALEHFDRVQEREQAEERIKYLATHDSLTDLPNRAMFNQLLEFAIKTARR